MTLQIFASFRRSRRQATRPDTESSGRRGLLSRFLRARSGATLVEYAFVSPIFLFLIFAIMENGLILMSQAMLDNATRDAARLVRIGQVQDVDGINSDGTGVFKQAMCNDLGNFIPCNNLVWNVQSVANGGSFSSMTPATASGTTLSTTGFSGGAARALVLVQVAYSRTYLIPFLSRVAGGGNSGNLLLISSLAFQNENYR